MRNTSKPCEYPISLKCYSMILASVSESCLQPLSEVCFSRFLHFLVGVLSLGRILSAFLSPFLLSVWITSWIAADLDSLGYNSLLLLAVTLLTLSLPWPLGTLPHCQSSVLTHTTRPHDALGSSCISMLQSKNQTFL